MKRGCERSPSDSLIYVEDLRRHPALEWGDRRVIPCIAVPHAPGQFIGGAHNPHIFLIFCKTGRGTFITPYILDRDNPLVRLRH
jgi:hypothetical protein